MLSRCSLLFALFCLWVGRPNLATSQTFIDTYSFTFPRDLAVSGDYMVVLETNPDIYKNVDGQWVWQQQLLPDVASDRGFDDRFGGAIAMQNNTLVVNAQNSVYIYELLGNEWVKTHRFAIPESALGEYPTLSTEPLDVAIEGDQIIAATGFSNQFYGGGALFYYKRNGTQSSGADQWDFVSDFFERGGRFGNYLALSEDHLAVSTQGLGHIFTYTRSSNEWEPGGQVPLTRFPYRVPLYMEGEFLYLIDPLGEHVQIYSLAGVSPSLESSVPIEFDILGENRQFPRDILKVDNTIYLVYGSQIIVFSVDGDGPAFTHRIRDPGGITKFCCELITRSDNTLLMASGNSIHEMDLSIESSSPAVVAPSQDATNMRRDATTLRWLSAPDALSYDVQVWSYNFRGQSLLAEFSTQETSATVSLPEYGTLYSWWIRSKHPAGVSNWSPVFSFTTEEQPDEVTIWESRFDTNGTDSTIFALVQDWEDKVYAGGAFLQAGTSPIPYIAYWTGSQWSPVGAGVNGPVRALVFNSRLSDVYVVGDFDRAGSLDVKGFARWRRDVWDDPLNGNFEGKPTHLSWDYSIGSWGGFYLATYDESPGGKGRLYQYEIQSEFDPSFLIQQRGSWIFADSIRALDVLDGQVLIGFDHPASGAGSPQDCQYVGCVALINGTQPVALDPGFPADSLSGIDHVAIAFRDYYVAGDFNLRGAAGPIAYLGKYDGNEWNSITTLEGPVTFLDTACKRNCERFSTSQQLLYVGSAAPPHIGYWNNNMFLVPDGGTNGPVYAAAGPYVGGDFSQAGGILSYNIGLWRGILPVSIEEIESVPASTTVSVYPNPASSRVQVAFGLTANASVTLEVIDLLGRVVMHIDKGTLAIGEYIETLKISSLATGTYFIVLQLGQDRETLPVVVVNG